MLQRPIARRRLREREGLAVGNTCRRPTERAKPIAFSFRDFIGGFAHMMHLTEEKREVTSGHST